MANATVAPALDAATRLRALLHEHGLRYTPQRMAVVQLLEDHANAGKHLSAPAIHTQLAASDDPPDMATVYRTLTTLAGVGLLHSVVVADQPAAYGLTDSPHLHALCSTCGDIRGIPAENLTAVIAQASRLSNYDVDASSVIMRGTCSICR